MTSSFEAFRQCFLCLDNFFHAHDSVVPCLDVAFRSMYPSLVLPAWFLGETAQPEHSLTPYAFGDKIVAYASEMTLGETEVPTPLPPLPSLLPVRVCRHNFQS